MRTTAGNVVSNVVDLYNVATGAWSTAQLSVGRQSPAAASVGNAALFAGGYIESVFLCRERGGWGLVYCCKRVECLRVLQFCGSACPATTSSLKRATAGGTVSNVVDVYNVATGAWSTAKLSMARVYPTAATVGNVVLFAGGTTASVSLCMKGGGSCLLLRAC